MDGRRNMRSASIMQLASLMLLSSLGLVRSSPLPEPNVGALDHWHHVPSSSRRQRWLCCAFASTPVAAAAAVTTKERIRYRCRVAYDGSRFNGWQYQKDARTVQGELERVLSQRFNRTIRIVGAGRTDAGVHARGQAFHFDLLPQDNILHLDDDDNVQQLQTSMNRMLPPQIRIWNLQPAPLPISKTTNNPKNGTMTTIFPWHVIYNSVCKLYSYRLCLASAMDPCMRYERYHVDWGQVNLVKLEWTLKLFEGTHDFRAFSGAIEQKEKDLGKRVATIRTVYSVHLVTEDECKGLYRVDFLLQGALYKMVRTMMGTALQVARGRMDEATFLQLLHHHNNTTTTTTTSSQRKVYVRNDNPCKPAPPKGLTLERVFFDNDDF